MHSNEALIIMIRNPMKGHVKTRIADELGEEKALAVYMKLLGHTNEIAKQVDVKRFLFYSDLVLRNDLFPNDLYKKYVQCSGDLGMRMDYAFSIPFKDEYRKVVMIGSDCIDVSAHHITAAFHQLDHHDFVIGPATDGGYYLIGMKKWNRWIFENKSWSTNLLFAETTKEISEKNGSFHLLEELGDIDTAADARKYPLLAGLL